MTLRLVSSGKSVSLGGEIARGGEGAIYPVTGQDNLVAKLYLKPPSPEKLRKLKAMSGAATEALFKVSAWPTDLIDETGKGIRGFVMPRITAGEEAHELYSARSRANAFPDADFKFIVHVAANVARAFATVHDAGHVIGDVNHAHLLVGRDGRVSLVDVDSIQVTVAGETFGCDVGQPLFTPPELQDGSFHGVTRTAGHDAFGLAVLLFHLLFMGRHPFAGVWQGSGEMPIERAIKEGRFAYSAEAATLGMKRQPGTLPLQTFGGAVGSLFESAFRDRPDERPTAASWLTALKTLSTDLRQCAGAVNHFYPRASADCPWCQVERTTGARLFGYRIASDPMLQTADIATLWRAIGAVAPPPPDPELPSSKPFKPPRGWPTPALGIARRVSAIVLAMVGVAGCNWNNGSGDAGLFLALLPVAGLVWPDIFGKRRRELDSALSKAKLHWKSLEERWKSEATVSAFRAKRAALDQQRNAYIDMPNERVRRLAQLEAGRLEFQKHRYLDRFRISRSQIPGIGPGRAATLASFGVETASDVDLNSVKTIPGFGPKLCGELLSWRERHELNFRFNSAEPVDAQEIARMDQELRAVREMYLKNLRDGRQTLTAFSYEVVAARARLLGPMETAWLALKRAEAERAAL
jgi:DNA-binding helix-hairpin-helix protein with protein kinase domain